MFIFPENWALVPTWRCDWGKGHLTDLAGPPLLSGNLRTGPGATPGANSLVGLELPVTVPDDDLLGEVSLGAELAAGRITAETMMRMDGPQDSVTRSTDVALESLHLCDTFSFGAQC